LLFDNTKRNSSKLRHFFAQKQANQNSQPAFVPTAILCFTEGKDPGKKKARTKGSGFSVEFVG